LKWTNKSISEGKRAVFLEAYGTSKATLYSGLYLAYHPPMPQTGIPAQILKRSPSLLAMAVSSEEAIWIEDP
jgi:hypothetical protein